MSKALQRLGLGRSQVDVEVVSEGRSGILGVGAQPARVIVTPRPGVSVTGARPAPTAEARDDGDVDNLDDDELDDEADEYDDDEDYEDEDEDEDEEEFEEELDDATALSRPPPPPLPAPPMRPPAPAFGRGPGRGGFQRGGPDGGPGFGGPPRPRPQPRAIRPPKPLPVPAADPADPIAVATEILEHLLQLMDIEATVNARPPASVGDGTVDAILDIEGEELGGLIGRRGETLGSLQYLVNLMLNRRAAVHASVGIDIEGYRRRRETSLTSLAQRMAERVVSSGQSITLEPMPPNERRIVHIALQEHPDVLTVSIGEGEARKVAITPRR